MRCDGTAVHTRKAHQQTHHSRGLLRVRLCSASQNGFLQWRHCERVADDMPLSVPDSKVVENSKTGRLRSECSCKLSGPRRVFWEYTGAFFTAPGGRSPDGRPQLRNSQTVRARRQRWLSLMCMSADGWRPHDDTSWCQVTMYFCAGGVDHESVIWTSGECLARKRRRPQRFHCTGPSAPDVDVDRGDPCPSSSSVGDAERQRRSTFVLTAPATPLG